MKPMCVSFVAAMLAMFIALGDRAWGRPPILEVDQAVGDSAWRVPATLLHGVSPLGLQRGVHIDGTARRASGWGASWLIEGQPFERATSPSRELAGVDLLLGVAVRGEMDLNLPSAGPGWPIGRTYAGAAPTGPGATAGGAEASPQGRGWFSMARPELVFDARAEGSADDRAYIVYAADGFLEFRYAGVVDDRHTYRGVNGTAGVLVQSGTAPVLWRYVDLAGQYAEFFGWGQGIGAAGGQLWRVVGTDGAISAVGDATDATAALAGGFAAGTARATLLVERSAAGEVWRRYTLKYGAPVGGAARLERVVAEAMPSAGGGGGQPIWLGEVRYHYFGAAVPACTGGGGGGGVDPLAGEGLPGDLREVVTSVLLRSARPGEPEGGGGALAAMRVVTRVHYRYEVVPAVGEVPATSRLRRVYGPEGVRAAHFTVSAASTAAWEDVDALSAINCIVEPAAELAEVELRYGAAGSADAGRVVAVRSGSSCSCAAGEHLIGYVAVGGTDPAGYQAVARWVAVVQQPTNNVAPIGTPAPPLPAGSVVGVFEATTFDECGQTLARQVSTGDPRADAGTAWTWGVMRDAQGLIQWELDPSSAQVGAGWTLVATGAGTRNEFVRETATQSTTRGYVLTERQGWANGTAAPGSAAMTGAEYSVRGATHLGVVVERPWVSAAVVHGVDAVNGERTDVSRQWHGAGTGPGWAELSPRLESVLLPAVSASRMGSGVRTKVQRAMDAGGRVVAERSAMGRVSTATYGAQTGLLLGTTQDASEAVDGFDAGDELGGTPTPRTATMTYDEVGRLVSAALPDGRRPRIERFVLSDHRVATVSSPSAVVDGGGAVTGHRLPLMYSVTDHAGGETVKGVVGVRTASEPNAQPVTTISGPAELWLDVGATTVAAGPVFGPAELQLEEVETSVRTLNGSRLLRHEAWNGPVSATQTARVTQWTYDASGRVARVRAPDGTTMDTVVDALGRTVAQRQGLADASPITALPTAMFTVGEMEYDSVLVVRGENEPTRMRLIAGPGGAGVAGEVMEQTRSFDARGRVVGVRNPGPPHTVMGLDNLGRPVAEASYGDGPGAYEAALSSGPTHAGGRVALWAGQYDELGRLARSRQIRPDAAFNGDLMAVPTDAYIESRAWRDAHGRPRLMLGESIERQSYNRHDELIGRDVLASVPASLTYAGAMALTPSSEGVVALESCMMVRVEPSGRLMATLGMQLLPGKWDGSTPRLPYFGVPPIAPDGDFTLQLPPELKGLPDIWFFDYDELNRLRRWAHAGNLGQTMDGPAGGASGPSITWNQAIFGPPSTDIRGQYYVRDGFGRTTKSDGPEGISQWGHDFSGRGVSMLWFPKPGRGRAPAGGIPELPNCPEPVMASNTQSTFDPITGRLTSTNVGFASVGQGLGQPNGARLVKPIYANGGDCESAGTAIRGDLPVGMIYTGATCVGNDPPAHQFALTNFDWLGRVRSTRGIDGMFTEVEEFDFMGRPKRVLRWRGGGAGKLRLSINYDPAGRPVLMEQSPVGAMATPDGVPGQYAARHIFQYDAWGNLVGSWMNPDPTGVLLPAGLAPAAVPGTVPGGYIPSVSAPAGAPFGVLRDWRVYAGTNSAGDEGWRRLVAGAMQTPGNMTANPSRPWLTHPWQGVVPAREWIDTPGAPAAGGGGGAGWLSPSTTDIDKLIGRVGGLIGGAIVVPGGGAYFGDIQQLTGNRYLGISGQGWNVLPGPGMHLSMYVPFMPGTPVSPDIAIPEPSREILWQKIFTESNATSGRTAGLDRFNVPEATGAGWYGIQMPPGGMPQPNWMDRAAMYEAAANDAAGTPVGMIYKGPAIDLTHIDRDCEGRLRNPLRWRLTGFVPPDPLAPQQQSGLTGTPRWQEKFRLDPLGNPTRHTFIEEPCELIIAGERDTVGRFDPDTAAQSYEWSLDPADPDAPWCAPPADSTTDDWTVPVPGGGGGGGAPGYLPKSPLYDENGNRKDIIFVDGNVKFTLGYDVDNRLSRVDQAAPGSGLTAPPPRAVFGYDALGRKAWAQYVVPGTPSEVAFREFYTYDELWRLVSVHRQERPEGAPTSVWGDLRLHEQYVWHARGLDGVRDNGGPEDRLAVRFRDADGDPCNGLEEAIYPLTNLRGDVVALCNDRGRVLEWIEYTANGLPRGLEKLVADVAADDGSPWPDGNVNNGDFQLFFAEFFSDGRHADVANTDGEGGPDGNVDNGDFQAFFQSYMIWNGIELEQRLPPWGRLSSTGWVTGTRSVPTGTGEDPCAGGAPRSSVSYTRDVGLNWRFGHAGYEYDAHIGVYHVRNRVLDPRDGRWLQRDPIGYAGGWNLYQYANGDPFRYVDPSGLWPAWLSDGLAEFWDTITSVGDNVVRRNEAIQADLSRMARLEAERSTALKGNVAAQNQIMHEVQQFNQTAQQSGDLGMQSAQLTSAAALMPFGFGGTVVMTGAVLGANAAVDLTATGKLGVGTATAALPFGFAVVNNALKAAKAASVVKATAVATTIPKTAGQVSQAVKMTNAALAEARGAAALQRAGYTVHASKLPGNKGIDLVGIKYKADGTVARIIIVESKYAKDGVLKLSYTKTMGKQMSNQWIDANIAKMIQQGGDVGATGRLLDAHRSLTVRRANVLDPFGINRWTTLP